MHWSQSERQEELVLVTSSILKFKQLYWTKISKMLFSGLRTYRISSVFPKEGMDC